MHTQRRLKISLLGLLAIVGGAAGLGSIFYPLPWAGSAPYGLGMIGVVISILALLLASARGHTGRAVPLLGLLLSGSAVAWAMLQGQRTDRVTQQFDVISRVYRDPAGSASDPAAPKPVESAAGRPASDSSNQRVGHGTIFDTGAGPSDSVNPKPPAVIEPVESPASAAASLSSRSDLASQISGAQSAVVSAKAKWDASVSRLIPALSKTAAYQSASAAVQSAEISLKNARASNDPGSSTLTQVSGQWVDAKSALQKLIDSAARADPIATAAKQEWLTAESRLSALKAQLLSESSAVKTKPKPAR